MVLPLRPGANRALNRSSVTLYGASAKPPRAGGKAVSRGTMNGAPRTQLHVVVCRGGGSREVAAL